MYIIWNKFILYINFIYGFKFSNFFFLNIQIQLINNNLYLIILNKFLFINFLNKYFYLFKYFIKFYMIFFNYNIFFIYLKKKKFNNYKFIKRYKKNININFLNFYFDNFNLLIKNILINFFEKLFFSSNFLIIYGEKGAGKTFLLIFLYNYLIFHNKNIIFVNSKFFFSIFIFYLKKGNIEYFIKIYNFFYILIIDDVNYIFNLLNFQKNVINIIKFFLKKKNIFSLCSDEALLKLKNLYLKDKYYKIFIELKYSNLKTNIKILNQKLLLFNIFLSYDNLFFIIINIKNNFLFFNFIKKILSYSFLTKNIINKNFIKYVINLFNIFDFKIYSLQYIMKKSLKYYGIFYFDIFLKKKKNKLIKFFLQMVIYLMKLLTNKKDIEISKFLKLNVNNVYYFYKKNYKLIKFNKFIFNDYINLKKNFFYGDYSEIYNY